MTGDKKSFLFILIVLILISIGGVWASEDSAADVVSADDGEVLAMESSSQPDTSVNDKNLSNVKNDEPADVQSVADSNGKNDEVLGASADNEVLGRGISSLSGDIGSSAPVLTESYNGVATGSISISSNKVITGKLNNVEGQSITIDGSNMNYRLFSISSTVTFKNIIFKGFVNNLDF